MRRFALSLVLLVACDSSTPSGTVDAVDGSNGPNIGADTGGANPPGDTSVPSDANASDAGVTDTSTGGPDPVPDTTSSDTSRPDASNPTEPGSVGSACSTNNDCGPGGVCITELPGGYCAISGCSDASPCPAGSSCWGFGDAGDFCIKDCESESECRVSEGYTCDADKTCWPASTGGSSPIGGACESNSDCKDAGAFCYPAVYDGEPTGFFQGYCMIADCTANSCPEGSRCEAIFSGGGTACVESCGGNDGCNEGYGCFDPGMCFPSCAQSGCPTNYACEPEGDFCKPACTANSCPNGSVCRPDGTCGAPPCQQTGCTDGYLCADSGECVIDLGDGPGAGPGPTCADIPARDCTGTASYCGEILPFEPDEGPGYWDYPLNGETQSDQYRSYARRDLQMLIKWATATVKCKTAAWQTGNGLPLGLGDMSEANGDIPGTREGQPGHPAGTHEEGYDMDIAYYQTSASPDNKLRPVCVHKSGNQDQYHCVSEPTILDVWRNAMFLGLLLQSPRTRVIGVDGKVGPLVERAMDILCDNGWLTGTPCTSNRALAYETEDEGRGWYYFHHHHLHISLKQLAQGAPSLPGMLGRDDCLVPGCEGRAYPNFKGLGLDYTPAEGPQGLVRPLGSHDKTLVRPH